MIRNIYPLSRLGRGLSFNTVIAASAASFAPTVGGAILTVAGWPWLFATVAPFGVLSILIGRKALPESQRHNDPYDILAAVMCAATFGLMVFGLETAVNGDSLVLAAILVASSVSLGFLFVRRELNQPHPVLPVDLLRVKGLIAAGLAFIAGLCSVAVLRRT